jgi:hypothetical protein
MRCLLAAPNVGAKTHLFKNAVSLMPDHIVRNKYQSDFANRVILFVGFKTHDTSNTSVVCVSFLVKRVFCEVWKFPVSIRALTCLSKASPPVGSL